jgi:2-polyprenyl-3-methyl-5-hydroxy-6-metoxy-1,4-benzoquinol methylase
MPSASELAALYPEDYRRVRNAGEAPTPEYVAFMDLRARSQRDFVEGALARRVEGSRVLDVGCGAGSLLAAFAGEGNHLTGYEPDRSMSRFAAERLPAACVAPEFFDPERHAGEPFDLITSSHVHEHVPDPVGFLSALLRLLRPGGVVFLEVPHDPPVAVREQIHAPLRGKLHLSFFVPETLRAVIAAAGGRVVRMIACGPRLHDFSPVPAPRGRLGRRVRYHAGCFAQRAAHKLHLSYTPRPPVTLADEMGVERPDGIALRALVAAKDPPATR